MRIHYAEFKVRVSIMVMYLIWGAFLPQLLILLPGTVLGKFLEADAVKQRTRLPYAFTLVVFVVSLQSQLLDIVGCSDEVELIGRCAISTVRFKN